MCCHDYHPTETSSTTVAHTSVVAFGCHYKSICSSMAAHSEASYVLHFQVSQSPQGCQRTSTAPETNQCIAVLPKTIPSCIIIDKVTDAVRWQIHTGLWPPIWGILSTTRREGKLWNKQFLILWELLIPEFLSALCLASL